MSKYSNKKTKVGDTIFDSKKEASRYIQLKALQNTGAISELKLQPKFELQEAFSVPVISLDEKEKKKKIQAIYYISDFQYKENIGGRVWDVVEDVKGMKTDVYNLKKKLFLYKYPNFLFRET